MVGINSGYFIKSQKEPDLLQPQEGPVQSRPLISFSCLWSMTRNDGCTALIRATQQTCEEGQETIRIRSNRTGSSPATRGSCPISAIDFIIQLVVNDAEYWMYIFKWIKLIYSILGVVRTCLQYSPNML